MAEGSSFMDKFAAVSTAIGNQIHLRSLRDSFSSIITLFILGGVAVLFNNVIFPAIMQGDMLTAWQTWGNAVLQGTQNFASVMLAGMIGFSYARNVRFDNAISCVVVGIAAFIIVIPQSIEVSGNLASLDGLTLGEGNYDVSQYVTSEDGNYALLKIQQEEEANTDANTNDGDVEDVIPFGVTSLITEDGTTVNFNQAVQETEDATAASLGTGVVMSQALTSNQLGTNGLFVAIVMGLVATSVFIWLSGIDKLKINLGEGVPPAVAASFNVMIPMAIVLMGCGLIAALLAGFFDTSIPAIINMVVQEPLRVFVGENIWGAAFIFCMGQLLFTLGIHHTTINGTLLEPIMLVMINENTEAFNAGVQPINMENYHYLNYDTQACFGTMGGSGCTIGLIIATFAFSKSQSARAICALATAPGIFEINEPIIYGYPIVYNLPLMIAFVASAFIGYVGSYFLTVLGLMNPCFIMVPWTTPPLINSFLATAGDWRAPICQLALIAVITVVYIFFMKIAEAAGTGEMPSEEEA